MRAKSQAVSPFPSMGSMDWGLLFALSVLWGSSFFFVGIAVRDLPTLTIVALRVGLAAGILWGCVLALGRPIPRRSGLLAAFLGMGLLNNVVPFTLIVWSQGTIPSGTAAILNATTPLFTIVMAGLFLADERFSKGKALALALGFLGVVVLMGGDLFTTWGQASKSNVPAQLAVLGAALSYAIASVFGRRFKTLGVDPMVTAAGQVSASSLVLVPMALVVERPWTLPLPGLNSCAAILGLASLSTALAYVIYFRILGRAGATNLALVTFLIPISAVLMGILFLGEHFTITQFGGMALIGLSLIASDGRLPRILGARETPRGE